MASLELSTLTREYVRIPVTASADGVAVDPTADVVEMAFKTSGTPAGGDWHTAAWESGGPPYVARILVGPGALDLSTGTYDIWLRITDNPEIPVQRVGSVLITDVPQPIDAFATVDDLEAFTNQNLSANRGQAEMMLTLATAAVRAYCRQHISLVADDEVVLQGNWSGVLELPERPAVSVDTVSINTFGVDFMLRRNELVFGPQLEVLWGPDPDFGEWGGPTSMVEVKYTHGYAVIPNEVKLATLMVAARLMDRPEGGGEVTGETIGSYSYTAEGVAAGLGTVEKFLLLGYRRVLATSLT